MEKKWVFQCETASELCVSFSTYLPSYFSSVSLPVEGQALSFQDATILYGFWIKIHILQSTVAHKFIYMAQFPKIHLYIWQILEYSLPGAILGTISVLILSNVSVVIRFEYVKDDIKFT